MTVSGQGDGTVHDFFILMGAYSIFIIGKVIYKRKHPQKVDSATIKPEGEWKRSKYFGKSIDKFIDKKPWWSVAAYMVAVTIQTFIILAIFL